MFCFLQGFQARDTSKRTRLLKRPMEHIHSSSKKSLELDFEKSLQNKDQLLISDLKSTNTQANFSHKMSQQYNNSAPLQPQSTSTPKKLIKESSSLMSVTNLSMTLSSSSTPSSRQKKFHRHFTQTSPDELVINYYKCALDGDILRQGHLYITQNYFAFYCNVFGNVTKLLLSISSIQNITKEKTVKIFPNAIAIVTDNNRHVFCSLLSRDSTFKLMMQVWEKKKEEATIPISGKTEFSHQENRINFEVDEIGINNNSAVIDSETLSNILETNSTTDSHNEKIETFIFGFLKKYKIQPTTIIAILIALLVGLYISAAFMMLRIDKLHSVYISHPLMTPEKLTHAYLLNYLDTNLNQIVKVRENLQSLSEEFLSMSQKFDESQTDDQTGKSIDSPT